MRPMLHNQLYLRIIPQKYHLIGLPDIKITIENIILQDTTKVCDFLIVTSRSEDAVLIDSFTSLSSLLFMRK